MSKMTDKEKIKYAEIRDYAFNCHASTNHLYDNLPYEHHLRQVLYYALEFESLWKNELDELTVVATCWCHDLIEDTRQTYNDVREVCGKEVAEAVFALTNEKGKTRKTRANAKYYQDIRNNKVAHLVKICDRLANIAHSVETGSKMADMYRKENKAFRDELYTEQYHTMFEAMEELLSVSMV